MMLRSRCDNILLVAGEGGHFEQMSRLSKLLKGKVAEASCIGEEIRQPIGSDHYFTPNVNLSSVSKKKGLFNKFKTVAYTIYLFFWFLYIIAIRIRPDVIIFHGPLFCVPAILVSKLLGKRCFFIESWSKFSSRTKTGNLALKLGITVFYQNVSLKPLYPNGIFIGRL